MIVSYTGQVWGSPTLASWIVDFVSEYVVPLCNFMLEFIVEHSWPCTCTDEMSKQHAVKTSYIVSHLDQETSSEEGQGRSYKHAFGLKYLNYAGIWDSRQCTARFVVGVAKLISVHLWTALCMQTKFMCMLQWVLARISTQFLAN